MLLEVIRPGAVQRLTSVLRSVIRELDLKLSDKQRFGSHLLIMWNQDNSFGIVIRLIAGRPKNWGSIPGRSRHLYLLCRFQTGPQTHQPCDQSVLEAQFPRGVKLATHLFLVSKLLTC